MLLLVKKSLVLVASNRESFFTFSRQEDSAACLGGAPDVKANLKAVQGDLFMLEKYLFFVSKFPHLLDVNEIYQAVFSRVGAGASGAADRTFARST